MKFARLVLSFLLLSAPAWAAITVSTLTQGSDLQDRNVYNNANSGVASISPTANTLQIASITNCFNGGTPQTVTLTGNNLTWVSINTETFGNTNLCRATLFRAMGSSPSAGSPTMTIDASQTATNCAWRFYELPGTNTSGTNGSGAIVQSGLGGVGTNNTSLAITLSAFGDATNNVAFGTIQHTANETTTPDGDAGYAELVDAVVTGPACNYQDEWKVGQDTSVSGSWTTSTRRGGVAIEIKAAATTVPVITYYNQLAKIMFPWRFLW